MRTRLSLLGELMLGLVLGLGFFCAGAVLMGTVQWLASPAVAQNSPHGPVFVLHPQR